MVRQDNKSKQRRAVMRTALVLGLLALAFYAFAFLRHWP
jgi:hypothetical protein